MKVLHLAPNFVGNKLFSELFLEITRQGEGTTVYVPVLRRSQIGKNYAEAAGFKIEYSKCYSVLDRRLIYPIPFKWSKDLATRGLLEEIDLVHAHYLVTAGSVARRILRTASIPYVLTARTTDLNLLSKRGLLMRKFVEGIVEDAAALLFPSPNLQKTVLSFFGPRRRSAFEVKSQIVPNGLRDEWFASSPRMDGAGSPPRLIFAGSLSEGKNIRGAYRAAELLRSRGMEVRLRVAGDGPLRSEVETWAKQSEWVTWLGQVQTASGMIEAYGENDILVLPSYQETFGMVYIEAMSQGLPIVYTKGTGVDGFFEDGEVGFAVNPTSKESIAAAVESIIRDYPEISARARARSENFRLSSIASRLRSIYAGAIVGGHAIDRRERD